MRSENRLRKLQLTTSSSSLNFEEKIKALLQLGLDSFNLDIAILSHIVENKYTIINAVTPDNSLTKGTQFDLGDTYCRYTLLNGKATSVHHASASEWKQHPCFEKSQLEAYMGCAVYVQGKIYGTLNFSSLKPAPAHYDDNDMEFLQLMAQWIGLELERQRSEENLKKKNRLLAAISRTNEHFIANMNPQQLFEKVLNDVLTLSDSEYGFIGEVLHSSKNQPYLKTHAITNIAWNETTRKLYEENAKDGFEFHNLDTLFGEVLRTEKVVISNDPQNDSRSGGLPAGHPNMNAFMGIPIFLAGKFVAMAGLANRKDGYDLEILDFLSPLLSTCGNLINAYRVNQKRKETELALQISEERCKSVFQCAPFGVALIDLNQHCQLSNDALQKMLGHTQEELSGRSFNDFFHPDDRSSDSIPIKDLTTGKINSYTSEQHYKTKNGQTLWASLTLSLVQGPNEEPHRIIAMFEDITQRKTVENELQQFKTTLDQTLDCVFMFNPESLQFLYVNQGAMDQVGYSLDELLTKSPLDIKPNIDLKEFKQLIDPLIQKKQSSLTFETVHQHKNSTQIPVEIFLQYIAPQGEEPRFVAIVRDISERKKIDKMKNEFISNVSHELRTPLTSISGSLGLINSGNLGELPKKIQSLATIAHRNANRLITLINDILDMDKITSGEVQLHPEKLSLPTLIKQSIENNTSFADQYSVSIRTKEPIAEVIIDVDPNRFAQIMSNLISNAAKFSAPNDYIEISSSLHDTKVKISVLDSGPGIPEDFQPVIFNKFTQADSSNSKKKGGTGLGLSITKALLTKMHGEISFTSEPGKGSIFSFTLPITVQ